MTGKALKKEITKNAKQLISHITNIDEKDENFQICLSFVESNFNFHRFLSPDSHRIERSIQGMYEKLEIHSQTQKARDFRELVDAFLAGPGLEGLEEGKTATHYALLSLLLELADSPTKHEFKRQPPKPKPEESDNFDWTSYLLDGIDVRQDYGLSSDEEEDTDICGVTWVDDIIREAEQDQNSSQEEVTQAVNSSKDSSELFQKTREIDNTDRLESLVMTEYWKGKGHKADNSDVLVTFDHKCDWDAYQLRLNPFRREHTQDYVTEYQVLRETIWMLTASNPESLFVFQFHEGKFSLNRNITLSHVSTECLENFLQPLLEVGAKLCAIRKFVADVSVQISDVLRSASDDKRVPRTYTAFAASLRNVLRECNNFLTEQECLVMQQEEPYTLFQLTHVLKPWISKIDLLHSVFITGVSQLSDLPECDNTLRVTVLLNVLYQAVCEWDAMTGIQGSQQLCMLIKILIESSRPLIEIADRWINKGQLVDPMKEFVVHRNDDIQSLDETFWEKAFKANTTLNPDLEQTLSNLNLTVFDELPGLFSGQRKTQSNRQDCSYVFPVFLQCIVKEAILTGKSMEIFENLGRLYDAKQNGQSLFKSPLSLYHQFLEDLKRKLTKGSKFRDTEEFQEEPELELEVAQVKVDMDISYQAGHLHGNLTVVQPETNETARQNVSRERLLTRCFQEIVQTSLPPPFSVQLEAETEFLSDIGHQSQALVRVCEATISDLVTSRYLVVCSRLVEILNTQYHLTDCIHAMQRYFLMSSGDVMYDFYNAVFSKLDQGEFWKEGFLLDHLLHEAVEDRYPDDVSRLSVSIVKPEGFSKPGFQASSIHTTDCIRLNYSLPWPVDIVISTSCQLRYNQIFTFLLQIKRAKSSLEQLRFSDLTLSPSDDLDIQLEAITESIPREVRIQRYQILRFRLLHFVNSLHAYIMTRILHSKGLEFESQLEQATDLEQIIQLHFDYLVSIYKRCLLDEKMSVQQKAIVQVLNLSLSVSRQWRAGVDTIKADTILEEETELLRCLHFLHSFLANVVKRGHFPHLESLVFELESSLPTGEHVNV